jgi:hypothetical protein
MIVCNVVHQVLLYRQGALTLLQVISDLGLAGRCSTWSRASRSCMRSSS